MSVLFEARLKNLLGWNFSVSGNNISGHAKYLTDTPCRSQCIERTRYEDLSNGCIYFECSHKLRAVIGKVAVY